MKANTSAFRLSNIMKKAIEDHRITTAEFDEIMHIVHEDGHIDRSEQALLRQLHEMISNKTLERVPA